MQYNVFKFYNGLDLIFSRELTEDEFEQIESLFGERACLAQVKDNHYFVVDYSYDHTGNLDLILKVEDGIKVLSQLEGFTHTTDLTVPKGKQVFFVHVYNDEGYAAGIGIESKDWVVNDTSIEDTCLRVSHYFVANFGLGMAEEKVVELLEDELVQQVKDAYLIENEHYDFIHIDDEDNYHSNEYLKSL